MNKNTYRAILLTVTAGCIILGTVRNLSPESRFHTRHDMRGESGIMDFDMEFDFDDHDYGRRDFDDDRDDFDDDRDDFDDDRDDFDDDRHDFDDDRDDFDDDRHDFDDDRDDFDGDRHDFGSGRNYFHGPGNKSNNKDYNKPAQNDGKIPDKDTEQNNQI